MRGPTCIFWANLTPFSLAQDDKGNICCPKACGTCGGAKCHGRDAPGSSVCCGSAARDVGLCGDGVTPPCNVRMSSSLKLFYSTKEVSEEVEEPEVVVQAASPFLLSHLRAALPSSFWIGLSTMAPVVLFCIWFFCIRNSSRQYDSIGSS
jgi:hypothetical protein